MDPLDKSIEISGSITLLASRIGVVPSTISNWRARGCKIPPEHCVSIEQITDGVVTRKELRPSDWPKFWPELAGRAFISSQDEALPSIPEDCKAAYPLLKNCGRFKDERAIAYFLNLPPIVRTEIFNTTPPHQLISEAICLKAKPTQARKAL